MPYGYVVFIQDTTEYAEFERALAPEFDIPAAVAYLAQWDNGEYARVTDTLPAGSEDDTYREGDYILSLNASRGYAGLVRVLDVTK